MMRLLGIIVVGLFCSFSLTAQSSKISHALALQLSQEMTNELRIVIQMEDRLDAMQLHKSLNERGSTRTARVKETIQLLQSKASETQASIGAFIKNYNQQKGKSNAYFQSYWIANVIVLDADYALIYELAQREDVELISWDEEQKISFDAPIKSNTEDNQKSVNGIEPGLAAIKAPFMWQLGFSGRGTLAYSVDTGIWEEHPAINENFSTTYLPYAQSWYSFDQPTPADKESSHGTHTMGTVLGLERATNDTIGVAFNARFIATDPIVSNLAFIKPLSVILTAFEWALNPDGDEETSEDVPHVINNSWGIASSFDPDLCSQSYVQDIFSACNAADIAIVFSAGNSGPAPQTVSRPQYVVVNDVIPFTVGALNGNVPEFPIASFSSRGPSQCDVEPALKIKPEVSAPGVNVRSAIGKSGYDSYSGTSMAGPHVAGAFLLLKEAFPTLHAEVILRALFATADDLGEPGEDNTYGMGIINLEATFNYLSANHEPQFPVVAAQDLAIQSVQQSDASIFACDAMTAVIVSIENKGTQMDTLVEIKVRKDGNVILALPFTEILNPGEIFETTVSLPLTEGFGEYQFQALSANMDSDSDKLNNFRMFRIHRLKTTTLPFFDGFETHNIKDSDWFLRNPDLAITWDTLRTSGIAFSNYSARVNFKDYLPRFYQRDELFTPMFELPASGDSIFLQYDYAYRFIHATLNDSMYVYLVGACGGENYPLFIKGNQQFSTVDTAMPVFVPRYSTHWKTDKINLTQYISDHNIDVTDQLMVKFVTVNRGGSSVFIDNVSIFPSSLDPTLIKSNAELIFKIYPNPSQGNLLRIESNEELSSSAELLLFDLMGQRQDQAQVQFVSGKLDYTFPDLAAGLYFISIQTKAGNKGVCRFIKQ